MLKFLKIQDFAIIDNSEIDLCDGLNVISGETGSGKSIIMKAIKFVLGARADKNFIRNNKPFTRVQATFFDFDSRVKEILEQYEIFDDELIITRTLYQDGKSDIKINGCAVTLSSLSKICSYMVDIYNQEDHFSLLDVKNHLIILDKFEEEKINALKLSISETLTKIHNINKTLSENCANEEDKARELDLLKYQVDEIENNIFTEQEENELLKKKNFYNNFKKIYDNIQSSLVVLENGYNGFSISSAIKSVENELINITEIDENYKKCYQRLNDIRFEIEDITDNLSNQIKNVEVSESEIDSIEERLEKIKILKKKYGNDLEQINKNCENFKNRIDFLENNELYIKKLLDEKCKLIENGLQYSSKLSAIRKNIAKNFENNIIKELQELGMKDSKLLVKFSTALENKDIPFNKDGVDTLEFMFSANKGQDFKPLHKIISGGELSRFMLAYKNVVRNIDKKDLIIFDEIDAGISGGIGQKIAIKLNAISKNCQIISISHLAQIISMADRNFLVHKETKANNTISMIEEISGPKLENEIARVCGNGLVSKTNLSLAQELINSAKEIKDKN